VAGFLTQVFNRVRRAGRPGRWCSEPTQVLQLESDRGLFQSGVSYSVTVKTSKALHKVIAAIKEEDWTPIPYWIDDGADVAETTYRPFLKSTRGPPHRAKGEADAWQPAGVVLDLRLPRLHNDREGETIYLEADHRRHAVVEDVIRDLKYGVG